MKTDYEFIKDKFDESGVGAPESMDEQFVLEKIKDEKPKSKKAPLIAGLSFAAAVALFTAVAFTVTSVLGNAPKPLTVRSGTACLSNFKSSDDVKKALRKINEKREKMYGESNENYMDGDVFYYKNDTKLNNVVPEAEAGAGSASSDYGHNATYTQYTNVDEADTVKTDGRYIFYIGDENSTISVFSANGKNSKKLAEIKPSDDKTSETWFNDFYIYGNKLIAAEHTDKVSKKYKNNDIDAYISYTRVEIFDISNIKNIKSIDLFYQSGSYCSSRMIGGMMYVVSSYKTYKEGIPCAGKYAGATDDEAASDELNPEDIYTVDDPSDTSFLVVSSINTDDGAQAKKTKAILGSADTVYCNTEHLFVTAAEYDYSQKGSGFYRFVSAAKNTQIVKVDLNNNLDFIATNKVKGYVNNQYAIDEKDGYLRIAATDYRYNKKGEGSESNKLYVFDDKLKQVGNTTAFAEGESIKAVRYIGDTAYVITYEQTDPLFVIDTSDVKNPKILGEVKISGFSTLLVPVDDNTLLGIGYHTQEEADDDIDMEIEEGIKLALFDVSDKANPKVLDEKIFKNYSSEVQYNPKALLVNFARNDYTIPYSHYLGEKDEDYIDEEHGIINFKVENKKIKIVDEYVSDVFIETEDHFSDLKRCVYADDYIYMVGECYKEFYAEGYNKAAIDAVQYKQ